MKRLLVCAFGAGLTALGMALVCGSLIYWLVLPPVYRAATRVLVDPPGSSVPDVNAPGGYWMGAEFERLQSAAILGGVISNLDLRRKWGPLLRQEAPLDLDLARLMLKSKMELKQVRNTKLIEIAVKSEAPGEAAQLANAIATAYQRDPGAGRGAGSGAPPSIRVVDAASPPARPIRPRLVVALCLAAAGALASVVGVLELISGLRIARIDSE